PLLVFFTNNYHTRHCEGVFAMLIRMKQSRNNWVNNREARLPVGSMAYQLPPRNDVRREAMKNVYFLTIFIPCTHYSSISLRCISR
ncbi:MAG: hypothetical protein KDC11_12295, partial [Chitinophagaceae bacterium]|nr:hypothetical protein [Chitinophagaceae bacterium]